MEANTDTTYDFPTHIQGSTFKGVSFQILVNDVPLDLTGATIEMVVDTYYSPVSNVLTLSTELENEKIVITDAENGRFSVIPQIIDVAAALYKYDIKITTADSTVRKPISGKWHIVSSASYE